LRGQMVIEAITACRGMLGERFKAITFKVRGPVWIAKVRFILMAIATFG